MKMKDREKLRNDKEKREDAWERSTATRLGVE
ncbi:uncharacterized protein G2W53_043846 [Senna tora]|uniref:Uncharacterized protein n=1 Tax=Senna tora TaxID=362788 RepID=A0A834SLV9_9FABA|nr:uncharacterized protein G2W53_043846 [Senna tora]